MKKKEKVEGVETIQDDFRHARDKKEEPPEENSKTDTSEESPEEITKTDTSEKSPEENTKTDVNR